MVCPSVYALSEADNLSQMSVNTIIERELVDILDGLPKGHRKVFEPLRFDSDQWKQELKICAAIHGVAEMGILRRRDSTASADNTQSLGSVRAYQSLWLFVQMRLRSLQLSITTDTFNRCQDVIREIMLHLSLYARRLSGEDLASNRSQGMFLLDMIGAYFARPSGNKEASSGQRKNRPGQDSFRRQLITYYGCQGGQGGDKIWCPVLQKWLSKKECTAAHIIPYSFPPHIFKTMLFPEDETTMTEDPSEPCMEPSNGLYLYNPIENAFDDGKLVIVPREDGRGQIDFKVHLLDEKFKVDATFEVDGRTISWHELDGKSLEFKNKNRPAKRYLYLHILMTVVRKCVYQPPGWAYRLTEFIDVKDPVVLTPKPHLIEGPFMLLSRMITDRAVFEQVQKTIPMEPTRLPPSYDNKKIEEISEDVITTVADLGGLLRYE